MATVTDVCEMASIETSETNGAASVKCRCGTELSFTGYSTGSKDLARLIVSVWDVHVLSRWGMFDPAVLIPES